jgi:succinoglycan biosynthesis protein ExoA
MDPRPRVTVIIPCRNEEGTIGLVLDALRRQIYPPDRMRIVVADGRSADRTRELVRDFSKAHPQPGIRLIDNPGLTAPAGLNAGLRASEGEIVVRMDAHAVPDPDYVDQCVRALSDTRCEVVGGQWDIRPGSPGVAARAIAAAAGSPFGAGGARYRTGGRPGEVDTVPFGAFRRDLLDRVGFFNEQVPVNEDYEFFYRVRAAGGRIYFTPAIRTQYIARAGLRAVLRQYFSYGHQKAVMLSIHPRSIRIRQLIPAVFTLVLAAGAAGALVARPLAIMLGAALLAYAPACALFTVREAAARKDPALIATLPIVFFCMHVSWGVGFWIGLVKSIGRRSRGGSAGRRTA